MRILALLPDGFGGRGGIAKFNRDLLTALSRHPAVARLVALPRRLDEPPGALPPPLEYRVEAARGKLAFGGTLARELWRRPRHDVVIAGHLNLLPLAALVPRAAGGSLGLAIHGTEAWTPPRRSLVQPALRRLDWFIAVSRHTRERFLRWAPATVAPGVVIPNIVDGAGFSPAPPPAELIQRYRLAGRSVIMTLARLDARERCKGIDEMLAALPAIAERRPSVVYVVCGDGSDRPRLEAKARALGLGEHVRFLGYVAENEKADHYRLADCFVLAGWCEGFGIALLEAQASGIPVVASVLDGSIEAIADPDQAIVVDPRNPAALAAGVERALTRPRGERPAGLERFGFAAFEAAVHAIVGGG